MTVEGEIELENVDAGPAQESEEWWFGVCVDELTHMRQRQAARGCNAGRLQSGGSGRNVWIQPTATGRHHL